MSEEEARDWIRDRFGVPRETLLARLVDEVIAENHRQNLVAPSTIGTMWSRHIVDSAQLIDLSEGRAGPWLDIGTGAGFPGVVIACLRDGPMTLCEPRRRRAEFLERTIGRLGLACRTSIAACTVERITGARAIISARAVASLDALFTAGVAVSDSDTLWVLPKGRTALEEVEAARKSWHGSFHVKQSITDPASSIVVASRIRRRR